MIIDIKQRVREALEQGHLMSLGTVDSLGVWVADVGYMFDDNLNIYWMSSPNTRHSKAIELNGKVAASITISTKSKEDNLGLQLEGIAKKIDQLDFNIAKKTLREGSNWYMLVPTTVYLIDEKNFGFKRQKIEL